MEGAVTCIQVMAFWHGKESIPKLISVAAP